MYEGLLCIAIKQVANLIIFILFGVLRKRVWQLLSKNFWCDKPKKKIKKATESETKQNKIF